MPNETTPGDAQEKKHEFTIFIDAVKYHVDKTSMTGAEIKALARIDAQYQLFLEERGDQPDKPIKDTEAVSIRNDMHFYAIPPATMGWESRRA
jgi:Multiubiquitin